MSSELDQPSYRVPALDKALDLLECLAAGGVALTQAQLARELGRSPSELFRILATLERRGYVRRDPASGAYGLTLRLFELGHAHTPYERLLEAARAPMRRLSDEIRQGCHLSAIERGRLLVLHQVESPARVRVSVEIGSTIALTEAASGRVLLAALAPSELEALPVALDDGLAASLRAIRERGYEAAYGESIEGISDLAVLVGTQETQTKAALAVTALPRDREAFIRETLPPLRRCAAEIASAAGLTRDGEG